MKHSAMLKFTLFVLVAVALFLGGCVEVNNPDVKPTDFRSTVRFIDFANLSGNMVVSIDNSSTATATVTYQSASGYINLPAGVRFWSFSYGGSTPDTLRQSITPSYQYSFYSEYDPSFDATRNYMLLAERNTYAGTAPYPSGMQQVRFINLSPDTAADVLGGLTFYFQSATVDTSSNPVPFGGVAGFFQAAASSSPTYMVVGAAGDTLITGAAGAGAAGRYSVVFVGSQAAGTWTTKVFQEN